MSAKKSFVPVLGAIFLVTLIFKADCVHSGTVDYDYGESAIRYDMLDNVPGEDDPHVGAATDDDSVMKLPLCCPEGQIYDDPDCIAAPPYMRWKPKLNGARASSIFAFAGFPKCEKKSLITTYQKEVHFSDEDGTVFMPLHIHVQGLPIDQYCTSKIFDPDVRCEDFQTKIFTCKNKQDDPPGLMWTSVTLAHILLFLTLITFFLVGDLRCLQGQYMICFLISLVIYNMCLFPGSKVAYDISDVSCIALGAVKHFFFCGIFLWFNAICYDVWRTTRNRQDISGRRRFLIYSAYAWIVGAILTTVVLVLPYTREGGGQASREDPLKDTNYSNCKLKMEMNMILQIAQILSSLFNLTFLILATCAICGYGKFGNGLPRTDASLSLKQAWKLYFIMLAHMISSISTDIIKLPIPLWLYILIESVAVFGVFAYRRSLIKRLIKKVCKPECVVSTENGNLHEKGQLTTMT